jgi:hypothetical protein
MLHKQHTRYKRTWSKTLASTGKMGLRTGCSIMVQIECTPLMYFSSSTATGRGATIVERASEHSIHKQQNLLPALSPGRRPWPAQAGWASGRCPGG